MIPRIRLHVISMWFSLDKKGRFPRKRPFPILFLLFYHILTEGHQDLRYLRSGGGSRRIQLPFSLSAQKSCSGRPAHRFLCPLRGVPSVGKGAQVSSRGRVISFISCIPVQDRCHLFPADGLLRSEDPFSVSAYDLVGRRPVHRIRIPDAFCYVTEGSASRPDSVPGYTIPGRSCPGSE